MRRIQMLDKAEILLPDHARILIEQNLGGGYKIEIDAISTNVWLGFRTSDGIHYKYWSDVEHANTQEKNGKVA